LHLAKIALQQRETFIIRISPMQNTPSGLRPHIILLGRRNVGKSSLINALCEQPLSLVSHVPGTTTDPVSKAYELLPFGPVVFVDTGGIDDHGELGDMRVARTKKELGNADLALLLVEAGQWGDHEKALLADLEARRLPYVVVVNKTDLQPGWKAPVERVQYVSAASGQNVRHLREELSDLLRSLRAKEPVIIGDLVKPGDLVVMVVPIDMEAPAGRLILPQVMTIRDLLDSDAAALVVKESELSATVKSLGRSPDLVVCDSQVVMKVVEQLPLGVPVTTFSILFARLKGDLATFVQGAAIIDDLQDGDHVLIAEACSHHSLSDDIGTIKLPQWIRHYTGRELQFDNTQGKMYPESLGKYKLIVHCGGCMLTPKAMQTRMEEALGKAVPMTNYGVAISHVHGVLARVLLPFGGIDALLNPPVPPRP